MSEYSGKSIKILEGLDAVRKRPAMYIGSTDKKGLHHLVWEIVDNAVDEAINGYGEKIAITINKDGSITVEDEGRGVPVDKHPSGKSTPEVIYTVLHAGGKFDGSNYKVSGGLHGVGASVVNALSTYMKVEIKRDRGIYEISFKDGGKVDQKLTKVGTTNKTGTKVTFKPDPGIFKDNTFSFSVITERMQETAFLLKGITIEVSDEINNKKEVFHAENGIKDFVNLLNKDKKVLHDVIYFEGPKDDFYIEAAFQYNESYNENITSFVNEVKTIDGGTHEAGFKSALTRAFNDFAKAKGILKAKDNTFDGSDIREGLVAILSVKIPEEKLQFEGQTKGKLGTPEARSSVDSFMYEKLSFFLEEHVPLAMQIIDKASKSKEAREAARKARQKVREGKASKKQRNISDKLTPAQTKNKNKNELFLVEGDSAGGSAKQGRDRRFQAILPLRGKVINAEKTSEADMLKNEEIATMIYTIGAGYGANFSLEDCQYDKVIIMTDADDDGAHIQCLLLTFFYRFMKPLIEAGKLYIALPPLFKLSKGKETKYAYSIEEMKELSQGGKWDIQRYKGLGEMNYDQLAETTMNPETRSIIRVKIGDNNLTEKRVETLMGNDVAPRKDWIEENVVFSLEDEYKI